MTARTPKDLQGDIRKATSILEDFTNPSKGRDVNALIPSSILRDAHGIVFVRLYRVGFMISVKHGEGIIIARLPDGSWSAPSGISINSVGFGQQAGGEVIDSIIVMNYRAAVKAFFDGGGQLQLGVGASIAAGPYGRSGDIAASASSTAHIAATYAYSSSIGLYIGYSFDGSKISERLNTNKAYYGRPVSARDILTGNGVPPPQDAARLYDILNSLGAGPRSGLPFASKSNKEGKVTPTFAANNNRTSQQQQQHTRPLPPSPNSRPPHKEEEYEEPPPPYAPSTVHPSSMIDNSTNNTPGGSAFGNYDNNSQNSAATTGSFTVEGGGGNSTPSFARSQLLNQPPSSLNGDKGKAPTVDNSNNNHNYREVGSSSWAGADADTAAAVNFPNTTRDSQYPQDIKKQPPLLRKEDDSNEASTVVVAKYDFASQSSTDLSFDAGDHIIVTKRLGSRESWWEGEIGNKRGFFPANYTQDLTD